jgi:hypothetical protein
VSRNRAARSHRNSDQPDLSRTVSPRRRMSLPVPEEAAKLAIARRAKPSSVPDHVRLVLTLELRRALAEQLSARAIREERNIEAIIIALLESAAKRWR